MLSSKKSTQSRKEIYLKTRCSEQSAIIEAIQSEKNNRHEIVIITESLSTVMAA
jgi:cytidine deaminase